MKWIKKYETFVNDDNRGEDTQYPQLNPVIKMNASEYVDSKLKTEEKFDMFRVAGVVPPKDLNSTEFNDLFDTIREKAIEYFTNNPEEMGKPIVYKNFPVNGGDGIPRTNNVGGSSHSNSRVIGESFRSFDSSIEITEDDMNKFSSEEPLKQLISNGRIGLGNKKVEFNKSDERTIDTLDIYFEFDKSDFNSDSE